MQIWIDLVRLKSTQLKFGYLYDLVYLSVRKWSTAPQRELNDEVP